MAEKGNLQIFSRDENLSFEFKSTDMKYKLNGNVKIDMGANVITSFVADAYVANDDAHAEYVGCGSVTTQYNPSLGDDALQFNFYRMSRKTMRDMGDVIDDCLDQLNELINK